MILNLIKINPFHLKINKLYIKTVIKINQKKNIKKNKNQNQKIIMNSL
mgnify:CR=1 FL=1